MTQPLFDFLSDLVERNALTHLNVAFAKFLGVLVPGLGTGPEATIFEMPLHISIPLQLPWMPEAVPLFERDIFTISMGQVVATGVIVMLTACGHVTAVLLRPEYLVLNGADIE
jgi:hypothetical protein